MADPIQRIREASVALLLYEESGGVSIGSAIGVRVGRRTLLATAAHNLRRLRDVRPISRGRYRSDPMRPLAIGVGQARDGDVGWVEVRTSQARRSSLQVVDVADLEARAPKPASELLAFGFPASKVEPDRLGGTRFDLSGAEVSGRSVSAEPGRAEEVALTCSPDGLPADFRPSGLSGAGMWRLDGSGAPQLVALTRAWNPGSRCLLGTGISRWLALVRRSFS